MQNLGELIPFYFAVMFGYYFGMIGPKPNMSWLNAFILCVVVFLFVSTVTIIIEEVVK